MTKTCRTKHLKATEMSSIFIPGLFVLCLITLACLGMLIFFAVRYEQKQHLYQKGNCTIIKQTIWIRHQDKCQLQWSVEILGSSEVWSIREDGCQIHTKIGQSFTCWSLPETAPPLRAYWSKPSVGHSEQIGVLIGVGLFLVGICFSCGLLIWYVYLCSSPSSTSSPQNDHYVPA